MTLSANSTSPKASPELTFATPIAILGAGRVGGGLASRLARQGHPLFLGERNPDGAAAQWSGPPVTFTDPARAVHEA